MSATLGQIKKYGYYTVGEHNYYATADAFIAANRDKKPVQFYYHNNVFSKVDVQALESLKLADLYRDRAQQLRDTYDYLSLQYSGGSDSHNILMTFLKNNIKLDQVVVKIPKEFVEKGYHKPNLFDTSAGNLLSEWEYVIKPDLEYLAKHHPEIDILIVDWLEDPESQISEKCFEESIGTLYMTFRLKHPLFSKNPKELEMLNKGKSVAIIYGVDKPDLIVKEGTNSVYFTMNDKLIRHHPSSLSNPVGTEYFYFNADVPEVPFKMAMEIMKWFKLNPMFKDFLSHKKMSHVYTTRQQFLNTISKSIVYPYWDPTRFQVQKNNLLQTQAYGVTESDLMVYSSEALAGARDKWNWYVKDYWNAMDRTELLRGETFPPVPSKFYYLGEL